MRIRKDGAIHIMKYVIDSKVILNYIKRRWFNIKCKFCNGTKIIMFESPIHCNLGIMETICPCVEIEAQKFKVLQYKSLSSEMNNVLIMMCNTVGKLIPSAIVTKIKAEKFFRSQTKLIDSL